MTASLLTMSLFYRCFFKHFVRRNQQLGFFKWNIGWKWVNACLKIPFTKNMVSLETSQLFCIANHLTGFCIKRVLTERFFWTEYSKFGNVPKSVSDIDLFKYECKLTIFFFLLKCCIRNVTSGTRPFHLLQPKNLFWMIA